MNHEVSFAKAILWASAIWAAHMMAMLVATIVTVALVESCIPVLEEYDADLAANAVLAIDFSNYFRNYWYTLIVPAALDAAFLVGLSLLPPKLNWAAWLWSTLWLLGAILFLAFTTTAIWIPTVKTIQQ
jgi:hypothetical protein